jgi:hypothetical protein
MNLFNYLCKWFKMKIKIVLFESGSWLNVSHKVWSRNCGLSKISIEFINCGYKWVVNKGSGSSLKYNFNKLAAKCGDFCLNSSCAAFGSNSI